MALLTVLSAILTYCLVNNINKHPDTTHKQQQPVLLSITCAISLCPTIWVTPTLKEDRRQFWAKSDREGRGPVRKVV